MGSGEASSVAPGGQSPGMDSISLPLSALLHQMHWEERIPRNSCLSGLPDFSVWIFGGKGVRRVKGKKKIQPPLPSVILATPCYISVARQGSGREN